CGSAPPSWWSWTSRASDRFRAPRPSPLRREGGISTPRSSLLHIAFTTSSKDEGHQTTRDKGATAMRRGFGFLWVALTGILLAIVGTIAYQAGWAAGAATQLPAGAAATAPYYYYGPHFDGFGFFGFLFFLFFLFLLFGLFRALRFGRGWGYGGGGWGPRGGWGGWR